MYELVASALDNRRSPTHTAYLDGDLRQMSAQRDFLLARGFSVEQNDVYPCVMPVDEKPAIQAIYDARIEGWWNYERKLVALGICTQEQYNAALGR